MLARNLLSKTIVYGQEEMKTALNKLVTHDIYIRFTKPHVKKIIIYAWKTVKSFKNLEATRKFEIFNTKFWSLREEVNVDFSVGGKRKRGEIGDHQLIEEVKKTFNIKEEVTIFYTDGSRSEKLIATGSSVIVENQEIAYYNSLPKECSSYTAEAFAIKAVMDIVKQKLINCRENIIIFSDCKSVISAISNNIVNIYENITEIKS